MVESILMGGFKEYCATNGIRIKKTIPRTSQQNGVAERMNKTINERARSMRLHSGLPKMFWADAVYLINRGPSVPLEHRLPEEVWSGREVSLNHLKVFGCVSYVYIESNDRSKLDVKVENVFSLVMGMSSLATIFGMIKIEKSLEAGMWYFMRQTIQGQIWW